MQVIVIILLTCALDALRGGESASDQTPPVDGTAASAPAHAEAFARYRVPPPTGVVQAEFKRRHAANVAVKGTEVMEARTCTEPQTGEAMPYRLYTVKEPDPAQRYPLVLLLHHATCGGNDNVRHIRSDAGVGVLCHPQTQAMHPCFVLAPQAGGDNRPEAWSDDSWVTLADQPWPTEPDRTMRLALTILDAVVQEFPIDPSRIYISGASMGGYGTHDAITRRPRFFAGTVTICGGYVRSGAARLPDTAMWIIHGEADETINAERTRNLVTAIQAAGGTRMIYSEYIGVRHRPARDLAYADPTVIDWLFGQRR